MHLVVATGNLDGIPQTLDPAPGSNLHGLAFMECSGDDQVDLITQDGADRGVYCVPLYSAWNPDAGVALHPNVTRSLIVPVSLELVDKIIPADANGDGLLDLFFSAGKRVVNNFFFSFFSAFFFCIFEIYYFFPKILAIQTAPGNWSINPSNFIFNDGFNGQVMSVGKIYHPNNVNSDLPNVLLSVPGKLIDEGQLYLFINPASNDPAVDWEVVKLTDHRQLLPPTAPPLFFTTAYGLEGVCVVDGNADHELGFVAVAKNSNRLIGYAPQRAAAQPVSTFGDAVQIAKNGSHFRVSEMRIADLDNSGTPDVFFVSEGVDTDAPIAYWSSNEAAGGSSSWVTQPVTVPAFDSFNVEEAGFIYEDWNFAANIGDLNGDQVIFPKKEKKIHCVKHVH